MSRAIAIFSMTRPLNSLIAFASVWAGAIIAGGPTISSRILFASLSAALIAGMGNMVNDLFDLKTDRINKPSRPLVSGFINRRETVIWAAVFGSIGLLLSLFVHKFALPLSVVAVILLVLYSPVFKGLLYTGNLLVSFVASLSFIYGGMAADKPFGALILFAFSFFLHLGREIVKDLQDRIADSAAGISTGANTGGTETSRMVASLVFGFLILLTLFPSITGYYGFGYLTLVLLGVDTILIFSIRKLLQTDDPETMRRISAWLKAAMPMGLLAVLLGALGF